MTAKVAFRSYSSTDKEICLGLFDANCPEFFAANERTDYASFLDANPINYELCLAEGRIVGAYGLMGDRSGHRNLNWILLSPQAQGSGIGSIIMGRVIDLARGSGLSLVNIAASHKSAPFFARFGAVIVAETDNGWGPGMHRVDMELRP